MALVSEFVFFDLDLGAGRLFGIHQGQLDLGVAMGQFGLKSCELLARIMGVEHSQIRVQRLVAPGFARLPLQRTDLPLHLLDDVADAQQIRFGRLQFPQRFALLRLVFGDAGRFFENRAPILRSRAQIMSILPCSIIE